MILLNLPNLNVRRFNKIKNIKKQFLGCCSPCDCLSDYVLQWPVHERKCWPHPEVAERVLSGSERRFCFIWGWRRKGETRLWPSLGKSMPEFIALIFTDIVKSRWTWLGMSSTYQCVFRLLGFHGYKHYLNHSPFSPTEVVSINQTTLMHSSSL